MDAERVGRLADRALDAGRLGRRRRLARPSTARPSEVSATIGCRAPYSAGRMSSVIPASMTTCGPPRSRTWSTLATSQPERATSARPGSIARRRGRRSSGMPSSSVRQLASEPVGSGRRLVEAAGPGSRHRHRACRTSGGPPRSSADDAPARAGPRRARRPRPGAATRRAGARPRGRTAPPAWSDSHSTRPVASVSVSPNLEAPSPTSRPGIGLGRCTSGLSRTRTSSAGRPRRPSPARRAILRDRLGLVRRLERDPRQRHAADRGRPDGGPQVRVGLADALERDPAVRHAGLARDRPLPARDDVRAEAARCDRGNDVRDVVGLDRVLADPGVRERVADRGGGPVQGRQVGDEQGRPVPTGGFAQSIGDRRRADEPGDAPPEPEARPEGRVQSGTTSRTTVLTTLSTTAPTRRPRSCWRSAGRAGSRRWSGRTRSSWR